MGWWLFQSHALPISVELGIKVETEKFRFTLKGRFSLTYLHLYILCSGAFGPWFSPIPYASIIHAD